MSQFTTKLIVEPIGKNKWQLQEGFEYHVGTYPSDEIIVVPPGFITDFASIPKIFWPIIDPVGKHGKAAVIHDYCYYSACYSRLRSDRIFLEGMEVLEVEPWKRQVMFHGVVTFGWFAWYKHRRRESQNKQ